MKTILAPAFTLVRGLRLALPLLILLTFPSLGAEVQPRYYGHAAVHDPHGVIAPWYAGLNGPCDFRVRIAAETLKRYPWTTRTNAIADYPAYVFSGFWQISSNGVITPRNPGDWGNGDLSQRATSVLNGFVDYYRYTGDAAAIAHLTYFANHLLDHCQTAEDHPWPRLFVSVPTKGKAFYKTDPHGMIQLDLCASTGHGLLRAYQVTGNRRWLEAAQHWGDLLAERCNLDPNADPWPRYANPEDITWKDNKQTGGVTMILGFLDELIRLGHTGPDDRLLAARDAGRRYLREKLLPAWLVDETWGRYFWDWPNPTQNCLTTPDAVTYLLNHPSEFPNWRSDARNILTLFLNHTSASPASNGDVYSGAWAYPESSSCCGRSLWYAPIDVAPTFAQYAVLADDVWMRELAYRQLVLQTYDAHESGVSEDNIDGGIIVNGEWFNIAHPMPLRFVTAAIGWLPEELGANRENHIVRCSAEVNSVRYADGQIEYSTFDALPPTRTTLRLAFVPERVTANGADLDRLGELSANGYTVKPLGNGDAIVTIRHDGARRVVITGHDPQQVLRPEDLQFTGAWSGDQPSTRVTDSAEASVTARFTGNQVRVIGSFGPQGGLADVYLDGEKQRVPIDCWNPAQRNGQVLYYRNGLAQGQHTLKIVARGEGNPHSKGAQVSIDGVQFSGATGVANFPSGTGPTHAQRMIFGYPNREDYRDRNGRAWRPGTEWVARLANGADTVAACWWTNAAPAEITGTADPELYKYGIHGREFWVNLTVGPGRYHARLKFAASRGLDTRTNCFDIRINGERKVERLDVAATAGGPNRAVDLVFNDLTPKNGVLEFRFTAARFSNEDTTARGEAFIQALEIGPGDGGTGATPVSVAGIHGIESDPFDYFQNSWSLIGLKDYDRATRLTSENELLLENQAKARLLVGAAHTPLSRKQTKTLLEGWLPVVLLSAQEADVKYEFKLWTTPLPNVKDWRAAFDWPTEGENFLNWIWITASNVGTKEKQACVRLERTGTNAATLAEWTVPLEPQKTATKCFRIPFGAARDIASLDQEDPALWLERTVKFWRDLLATGTMIEVPCSKASQALKAAHVQQFIDNDRGVLKGGEGFYDEFYIRDGAYQILQFEEGGFMDSAKKAIESYLKAQRADGRFETQQGQFDANGQALWTLWQYWKITGDQEFLRRAYPQMRRAVEWIKTARRQAPEGSPFAGVLPNAIADGEYLWDGKHHIVGYDFWNLRGLLCTADAAEALGETADAAEFSREVQAYRVAIQAAWQRTELPHFPPSWEKAGTHWGNTETLWPTEILPQNDPRVTAALQEVRARFMGGFVEGTIRWSGLPDVIHPYMSSYTTMASLARGEHEDFVKEFYWYLLHSTATHAFPEGIYFKKRVAWSDTIPHATGAANYAFLLRHALVHEQGQELHLLKGTPDWWLEPGREIRIENAATHFGSTSLEVRGKSAGVEVDFRPPTRARAARVVLHLPSSRPLLNEVAGVDVVNRPDDRRRWDFPTVVELYRR
ncbi:MAG: malectin domain-containing carbohydrate-binding protein [Verrucomicrobiia bacterium]